MTVALERGVLYAEGREIATYDAEAETVRSVKRLPTRWHKPIAEAVGCKPRFIFGAGSGDPAAQGGSGEARSVIAASPDSAPEGPWDDDPEPERDARLGDRTPEWAEWLRRNDPQGYVKRYRLNTAFPRVLGVEAGMREWNEQPWEINERTYDPYKSTDRAVRALYGRGEADAVRR
ncbi:hypothetical protein BH09VER1_BH09VER1_45670 [soil metagenome]